MYTIYRTEWKSNGNRDEHTTGLTYTNEHEAENVAGLLRMVSDKETKRYGVDIIAYNVRPSF